MSTTTETTQTSTGPRSRISAVVNDPDFVAVALFSALGLLASFYLMTHVPVESFFFS
jgi:hypothetical protein